MTACVAHEPGFEPPIETPPTFRSADPMGPAGVAVPDRWWTAFDDPGLDAHLSRALGGNFDLARFRERLVQAREIVTRERSFLFPTLDYGGFAQQTRRDANDFRGEDRFGASLIGSYDVDLWGRNRSLADSAALAAQVAEERLKAAAISLSGEVASTYFALVEQRGQAAILEQQIDTNEQVLRVVRTRFGGGVVRASDVLRQERLLESTREQRAAVTANIAALEHALLVLTGRTPMEPSDVARDDLPEVPPTPALGLPSELVQRRPDVRSALFAIQGADAELAAAIADLYPSIRLTVEAGTVEEVFGDLFDNWFALIGVDVAGPIFDGDRRRAEVRRAESFKAERVNEYAQTILSAFRQVLDASARESARQEQVARLERQLVLARRTSERLNREYLNGDISYIDVLEALSTEQQLQRDLLSTRFARIAARIDLYVALAGGWTGIVPDEPLARDAEAAEDAHL